MAINDPYAPGSARQPRLRILCNGQPVGGPLEFEVTNNNYYQADTFTARFSLNADPNFGVAWWGLASTQQILLDMQRERGTTILYTSHNMAEVEKMCTRIIFLSRGRVLASGTPIEVTQTILKEDRDEPALEEVFLHVAQRQTNEAA